MAKQNAIDVVNSILKRIKVTEINPLLNTLALHGRFMKSKIQDELNNACNSELF